MGLYHVHHLRFLVEGRASRSQTVRSRRPVRTRRRRGSPPRRRRPCPLVCGALWLLPESVFWASLQARPQGRLMRAPVPSGQGVEASGTPRPKPVCGLCCKQFRVLFPRAGGLPQPLLQEPEPGDHVVLHPLFGAPGGSPPPMPPPTGAQDLPLLSLHPLPPVCRLP